MFFEFVFEIISVPAWPKPYAYMRHRAFSVFFRHKYEGSDQTIQSRCGDLLPCGRSIPDPDSGKVELQLENKKGNDLLIVAKKSLCC